MSKHTRGNLTVADSARREVKMLTKAPKLVLDPFGKTDVELKQPPPPNLGEFAVIVIATRVSVVQFTIAHPIGITDLDSDDWVAHRSDQIQGMLARAEDPAQAELNQTWTNIRLSLAVTQKLLVEKQEDGKKVFYYPSRMTHSRNGILEGARNSAKEASSSIKQQIAGLTKENMHMKTGLLNQLRDAADPLQYLDGETAQAEKNLREFWNRPEVVEEVNRRNPQTYRTLSGPYISIPQAAIPGGRGKRLEDVAIGFAKGIAFPKTDVVKPLPATGKGTTTPLENRKGSIPNMASSKEEETSPKDGTSAIDPKGKSAVGKMFGKLTGGVSEKGTT